MGPLDGTLGDVPCVHLSRCTKRSGMFSIHGKMSNPGDSSVGLVRGVAERRWPPSFSPTELLWKTTGSCLMMLGAGSGIGCLLGVFLGVAVCCQLSGTRACWVRPPRVRAVGTCGEPSRPRHIRALGTCGSGLRRRRCASCVAVLITARALCTLVLPSPSLFRRGWPPPSLSPLCQGPRHLQGAHVPAWGVCAPSRPPGPYQGPRHLRPPGG